MKRYGLGMVMMTTALAAMAAMATTPDATNRYTQTNFVANKASYKPTLGVEKKFINGWGIAIRPAGAGGHFWVTAKDVSYEYVGDVANSPNPQLRVMHQDALKIVTLPVGGEDKFATGVVFNGSKEDFIITQNIPGAEPVTAPAKFLFASDGGIISAWTERKKPDGTMESSPVADTVIDESASGAQFFGLAINAEYDRLYAADFGKTPRITVYDGAYKPVALPFDMPFDDNKNGAVDAGEYAPFNVQTLVTAAGDSHVFVAYAKTQACPKAAIKKGDCKKGEVYPGEEDITKSGQGRLAEFTEEGKLVAVWPDQGKLSAPWGLVIAPKDFGALSNALLVANFGDGTIAAYDAKTRVFIDVMRDGKGKPIVIDKVWGLLFGNGESLGDTNALYFAAGPKDETDGIFGSLRLIKP